MNQIPSVNMSQNGQNKIEMDGQIADRVDDEMDDFYHQMQISPNPSFSNLDGCLFDFFFYMKNRRYDSPSDQQQGGSGSNYLTPCKVKNILACYQNDIASHNDLDMIQVNQQGESVNLNKRSSQCDSSYASSANQRFQGDTSSPCFQTFHQDNDFANDLSSTDKFDLLEIEGKSVFKQKLNYTIDIEDFMFNCTPNPFCIDAQKNAEKVFINKRIMEIKRKKIITKRLFNTLLIKSEDDDDEEEELLSSSYSINTLSNTSNIPLSEPKTNPYKQIKKESQDNNKSFIKQSQKETIESDKSSQNEQIGSFNQNLTNHNQNVDNQSQNQSIKNQGKSVNQNPSQNNIRNQDTKCKIKQEHVQKVEKDNNKNEDNNKGLKMSTIACKCRKSLCLKLYCECFARGEICGPACICLECRNLEQYLEQRNTSIKQIEAKNPKAFLFTNPWSSSSSSSSSSSAVPSISEQNCVRIQSETQNALNEVRRGCNCKKSKCRKKYCECYMIGQQCSSLCQCIDCTNNIPHNHHSQQKQSPKPSVFINQEQISIPTQTTTNQSNSSILSDCKNNNDQSLLPLLKNFNKMTDYEVGRKKSSEIINPLKQINKRENLSSECIINDNKILKRKYQNIKKDQLSDKLAKQSIVRNPINHHSSKENKINLKKAHKIIKAKQINTKINSALVQ